jgi:hypothetical protein
MDSYKFVGVSRHEGKFKARFGNDLMRVKVLSARGDTDIDMVELPHTMTKWDAVHYLLGMNFHVRNEVVDEGILAALNEKLAYLRDKSDKEEKRRLKAEKAAAAAPSLEAIMDRKIDEMVEGAAEPETPIEGLGDIMTEANLEDAPF